MKVTKNFDIREFVGPEIWNAWGAASIWFVDKKLFDIAEFYKSWFKDYYKVDDCLVIVNNWHYAKPGEAKYTERGFRMPDTKTGGELSQHKFGKAFDCDIIIVKNGVRKELDYKEVQGIMLNNQKIFMDIGVTVIEDVLIAKTWLHTDIRNTGMDKIFVVKPR